MSTTQLINPATEEVLASVDHTDANAVDDAARCRNELVTRIGIGTLTSVTQGTWRTRSR